LNVLNPRFVEQVAAALGIEPALVEKEWHVVRAIRVISDIDQSKARPVFSGGTSLSVGWGLIKRFSEDIDFKVVMAQPANTSQGRAQRRNEETRRFDPAESIANACELRQDVGYAHDDPDYHGEYATGEVASGVRIALQVAMPRCVRQGLRLAVVTGGMPGVEVTHVRVRKRGT
jgi:Nucleotidyl transferase AbiEii toxin, Type IV TA system